MKDGVSLTFSSMIPLLHSMRFRLPPPERILDAGRLRVKICSKCAKGEEMPIAECRMPIASRRHAPETNAEGPSLIAGDTTLQATLEVNDRWQMAR